MNSSFNIASISDIHLGHRRVAATDTIASLNKYLNNDKFLSDIHIVVFGGDVFDHLLDLSRSEISYIELFVADFLARCSKYKVIVRVLEGTPSHDRGQSIMFKTMHEILSKYDGYHVDFDYVEALSIERIESLGINVLYVPDEWGPSPEHTLQEVREKLAERNLEQVDFAFMHGMFDHQIDAPGQKYHDANAYLTLVKRLIFIGHIHMFSQRDRILAQGSFDRLVQGDEMIKGFLKAEILDEENHQITFVENKDAWTFRTIHCIHEDVADNLLLIEKEVENFRPGSYVRLKLERRNAILANKRLVEDRWPHISWDYDSSEKVKKTATLLIDHKTIYKPVQINKQSAKGLIMAKYKDRGASINKLERAESVLADLL